MSNNDAVLARDGGALWPMCWLHLDLVQCAPAHLKLRGFRERMSVLVSDEWFTPRKQTGGGKKSAMKHGAICAAFGRRTTSAHVIEEQGNP